MSGVRGYSIAFARNIQPDKMKPYSSALPPIYEKYQGSYLAMGGAEQGVTWLTGGWDDRKIMIAEFPSHEAVGAFWWGEEYRAAAKLREGAVTVDAGQFDGTDAAPDKTDGAFLLILVPAPTPVDVPGGTSLIAAASADVTTLEGSLDGFSVSLISFADRAAADQAWTTIEAQVTAAGGIACSSDRLGT